MQKKINIVDIKGANVGDVDIPDACIELEKGDQAVHETVVATLAAQRAGTASTKTRSEVRGSGAKPYKQKGLGRARAGSRKSPIWIGGGRIFGPKPRSFAKRVNKKIRQLALKRTFSERLHSDDIIVIDELMLPDHKTKNVQTILKDLKLDKSVLLIIEDYNDNLLRATGNIQDVLLIKVDSVNAYQLLRFHKIVFTKAAFELFLKRVEGVRRHAESA